MRSPEMRSHARRLRDRTPRSAPLPVRKRVECRLSASQLSGRVPGAQRRGAWGGWCGALSVRAAPLVVEMYDSVVEVLGKCLGSVGEVSGKYRLGARGPCWACQPTFDPNPARGVTFGIDETGRRQGFGKSVGRLWAGYGRCWAGYGKVLAQIARPFVPSMRAGSLDGIATPSSSARMEWACDLSRHCRPSV